MDKMDKMDKVDKVDKVEKTDKVDKVKVEKKEKVQNNPSKRKTMEAYYRPESGSRYEVLRTMYAEE